MAEERMNLAALQQRDPYISEIIDTASQVALYLFNAKTNVWEKLSIAGSLFIYKRSASPEKGFMILNRLGLNNLVEPITKYLEFQRQDSFLLYRNIKEKVIYGVWFYEQAECQRFEQQLTRYVQKVMDDEKKKVSPTPSQVPAERKEPIVLGAGAQVDIMQMLSKAHQEYNRPPPGPGDVVKKTEPKPMIDNPNAAATKKTHLIRPRPLKMPDSEQAEEEEGTKQTPGTATISLDALFRTASLQQEVAGTPSNILRRSTSTVAGGSTQVEYPTDLGQEDIPPLLRQIMSTGSMVEDIERLHLDKTEQPDTADNHGLPVGLPDITQPPPGHPAYRGPSPREQKSPRAGVGNSGGATMKEKGLLNKKGDGDKKDKLGSFVVPGPEVSQQIVSGNLLPQFFNLPSSQPSQVPTSQGSTGQSIGQSGGIKQGDHLGGLKAGGGKLETGVREKVGEPETLLTPSDLLHSSSVSTSSSSATNVPTLASRQLSTSLAAAMAAPSTTELLSPMAFITPRKTPPVGGPEKQVSEEPAKESDTLPIAPLTKEQLQQAMLYLIKNDSDFIVKLHEGYLKSLQELHGHKT